MPSHSLPSPSGAVQRPRRVLLLLTPKTYRAPAFVEAAERLGIEVVKAIDMPGALAEFWHYRLGVDFADPEAATRAIVEFDQGQPVGAILAVDDSAALLAARASAALGLPHNSPEAAEAARNKHRMRTLLAQEGAPIPEFRLGSTDADLRALAAQVKYPCVVKPLMLSGSRGVIRADDPDQFVAAAERLKALLFSIDPSPEPKPFLIENFIPGFEVALEGVLDQGRLKVLALFDKPDPLDGPFFEETLYVTPSRLPDEVQAAIAECASGAARALGLREGPMHAELRVNQAGPWLVEVAGRSIGGLCSKTLRFGTDVSLEELILRQAFGMEIDSLSREQRAGGVMMIPIPAAGLLRGIEGVAEAEAVPGVEEIQITSKLNYPVVPLPEGDSYLGFIFARGETPAEVEAALREAHRRLRFSIEPMIPLLAV
ncbi:MAG TPA: ATP-grasp domain-containing protein [Anaerolineae bacterium]|nr:ATP-grasp domain-containing protein [Anaerolineae bacterium]